MRFSKTLKINTFFTVIFIKVIFRKISFIFEKISFMFLIVLLCKKRNDFLGLCVFDHSYYETRIIFM